jgi:hypothetical protein
VLIVVDKVQYRVLVSLLHLSRARCAINGAIIWCRVMPGCVPAVKVADVCEPVVGVGNHVLSVVVSAQGGDDSGRFIKSVAYGRSEDIVLER